MIKTIIKSKNSGFTMVETLVAVSIFSLAILALLVVLSQSISNINYAKSKITASYLGQEGVEYIRNLRDTYVLFDPVDSQAGWTAFNSKLTGAACPTANGCYINDENLDYSDHSQAVIDITLAACPGACPMMLYDQTTGKYGYTTGANSNFTRKITVSQISADELKVFSTVSWIQGSGTYSLVFSESLFNWAE